MKNKNEFVYEKRFVGDSVAKRGYDIYDDWRANKLSSRNIARRAEHVASTVKQKKTAASIEALALLFALDLRIKEKYNTFLRCLLSYFAWRRESRALKLLKGAFNLPNTVEDIRAAIELELLKLRENLDDEEAFDDDEETGGGKRNGKAEEEAVSTEEKQQDDLAEDNLEEKIDSDEEKLVSEEKAEELPEKIAKDEQKPEIGEQQEVKEDQQKEAEIEIQDKIESQKQEGSNELKEENTVSDEISDPDADKSKEAKTYNDAIDISPVYEGSKKSESSTKETTSFIDEVIMDNMVKGEKDFLTHDPLDDIKNDNETNRLLDDKATQQRDEGKTNDKNAYLYDKMILSDKGDIHQTEKSEATQQSQTVLEAKANGLKESLDKNDLKSTEQESKSLREMLKEDINASVENKVIKELNNTMSKESVEAFYNMQAEIMREQLTIASEELGIDAPVEIIGRPESSQPPITRSRT